MSANVSVESKYIDQHAHMGRLINAFAIELVVSESACLCVYPVSEC